MSPGQTMRRVVLPAGHARHRAPDRQRDDRHGQGHLAFIGSASSASSSTRLRCSAQRSFKIMPGFVAATLWYLIVCSILMVGQSYLERTSAVASEPAPRRPKQKLMKIEADH
jgi:polar amino acid transport system permease protein